MDRCSLSFTLSQQETSNWTYAFSKAIFPQIMLISAVKVTLPSIYPSAIPWKAHTNRKISMAFLQEKTRVLPKKPSSSGNVCIRYLHLVVRRERAHDLHSKAKRLRISCKKNFNFSELSFTVLSRELSAHAWCLFSCRPLQVTVKYYLNVIYIRVW